MIIYLLIINIIGFALMGIDKKRAKRNEWRIPEKTLLGVAAIGGAFGTMAGMNYFRHKTKHWYFKFGLPILSLIWIAVYFYCL